MSKKPVILITNDDGLDAKGIKSLYELVKPLGKIVVVAPFSSNSGMSQAITIKTPLYLKNKIDEENFKVYGTNGTPTDCVKLALNQLFKDKKPDLILSGINHGSNASISIFYSGTMGAVIEGCLNRIPSIGFSLLDYSPDADFDSAGDKIIEIVKFVLDYQLPYQTCLNVNIPAITKTEIKGLKVCRQTDGVWIEEFDKRTNPNNIEYFWLTGEYKNYEPEKNDTDEWALMNNYISIVPIDIDLTANNHLSNLKQIEND